MLDHDSKYFHLLSEIKRSRSLKLLALVIMCCFFCFGKINAQVTNADEHFTKVSGHISNPTVKKISIKFYRDFISRDFEIFDIPLDGINNFAMTFQLSSSTPAFLIYDGEEVPIYLDPSDDMRIHGNGFSFTSSVSFSGKGAGKSRFLKDFNNVFQEANLDYVLYELAEREPMDFKKFMDSSCREMWNFYKQFDKNSKDKFSQSFQSFAKAKINYWRAYNLMRYRIEHPLFNGINDPEPLPDEYYSFLEKTLISNNHALTNPNYLYFLDQYILFQNYLFDNETDINFNSISLTVSAPSMLVFSSPNRPPILEQIEKGTQLKFTGNKSEEISKIQIKDELREDHWYEVISTEGDNGWIHGAGVEFDFLEKVKLENKIQIPSDSKYRNVYELFTGRTLYFLLATDLYRQSSILSQEELEEKVNEFVKLNPFDDYDNLLLSALDGKLTNPELTQNNFRIVSQPNILSKPRTSITINETPLIVESKIDEESVSSSSKNQINKSKPSVVSEYVEIDSRPASRSTSLTSLSGKIENPSGFKPTIKLFTDPITLEEIEHELQLNSNNTFTISLELAQPTIGKLTYGSHEVELYLEPADLIQVSFKGNDMKNTIYFSGKGSAHNNYLKSRAAKYSSVNQTTKRNAETLKHEAFQAALLKSKNEKIDFLLNHSDQKNFSKAFRNFANADIIYWYGYSLLNYPWDYPSANNLDAPMKMPDSYYDALSEIPTSMEGALPNNFYTYYLDQFFDYQSEHPDNEGLNDIQLAEKYLVGEPLAFYKAKKLAIACKRGRAKKVGNDILSFIESNPYENYNDVLRLVYNEARGLVVGMKAPNFALTDIYGNEVSLESLKGKVIYLDFWATWCSPCVQKMKNSKSWKARFKDKDVAFIYVSLDKNKKAWEDFLKANDIEGLHIAALGNSVYNSQIAKIFKVKKIPAYFIIDKQGKIAFIPKPGEISRPVQDRIQELLLTN